MSLAIRKSCGGKIRLYEHPNGQYWAHLEGAPRHIAEPLSECEKLRRVKDDSQKLGEFLEWLTSERKVVLARYHQHGDGCFDAEDVEQEEPQCGCYKDQLLPEAYSIERLLAEYFEIDLKAVEREKVAILEEVRSKL